MPFKIKLKHIISAVLTALCVSPSLADSHSICMIEANANHDAHTAMQWHQNSAEKDAIYREVYYFAKQHIKQELPQSQKWGVILDIDETVLDNGAFLYQNSNGCYGYDKNQFSDFQMKANSPALPGAAKFTCDIQKMGGYVSLVSNRDGSYFDSQTHQTMLQSTADNLKKAGICFDQILLSTNATDKDKNARFQAVITANYPKDMIYSNPLPTHTVIAYVGDNVQDFPKIHQAQIAKQNPNGNAYEKFGQLYFALPNPAYGSWDNNAVIPAK